NDVNKFLTNPINEYILVGRLAEWNKINELIANMNSSRKNNDDFLLDVLFARKLLPNDEDVTGAAYGLLRLQMTYQLDTLDMADGRIVSSGWKINSTQDCWQLGQQAYMIGQYDYAVSWLKESLQR
ncbi:hypothetical protein DAPPUDRAFT_35904, partial [Daphnia pulex]